MEEKKLSEQESLELISQMIRSTRKNMEVGSGNQFLYWGYFTAALDDVTVTKLKDVTVTFGVLYGGCPLEHRLVQHVSVLGLYASYAAKGNSFGNYVYRPRHSADLESDRQPVCADRSHHVFAGIPLRRSQFFLDATPFSAL